MDERPKITLQDIVKALEKTKMNFPKKLGDNLYEIYPGFITNEKGLEKFYNTIKLKLKNDT